MYASRQTVAVTNIVTRGAGTGAGTYRHTRQTHPLGTPPLPPCLPRRWPLHLALSHEIVSVVKGDACNSTCNEITMLLHGSDTLIISIRELTADSGAGSVITKCGSVCSECDYVFSKHARITLPGQVYQVTPPEQALASYTSLGD